MGSNLKKCNKRCLSLHSSGTTNNEKSWFEPEFKVNFDSKNYGKEIKNNDHRFRFNEWYHVTVKQTKEKNDDGFATFVIQVQDKTYTNEKNENYDDIKYTSVTAMAGSTFWGSDYQDVPLRKIRFITEEMGKSF